MDICMGRHAVATGLFAVFAIAALSRAAAAEEIHVGEKPEGWVERAQFTTAIEDREPVDEVFMLDTRSDEVFFFTEFRQLAGRTLTHRWEHEGEVMAEVPFEVGGPRWRVFSKKSLLPAQTGRWTVVVVDESGWALKATMFEYRMAEIPAEAVDEPLPVTDPVLEPLPPSTPPEAPEADLNPPSAPQGLQAD